MTFSPTAALIWADGPVSDPQEPYKPDIRKWGTQVENAIDAYSSGAGSIAKDTRANLYADLTHDADVMAWVYADTMTAYNGIYRKSGASGSGSWSLVLPLPYSFIIASDIGAGTPNAIQATTDIPVSESALITFTVAQTSVGSPVYVSFNGGSLLTIKSNSGEDIDNGGIVGGQSISGFIIGPTFRLLNDEAIANLIYAARDDAEAAVVAAQAARDAAIAAENTVFGLVNGQFPSTQQFAVGGAVQSVNLGNTTLSASAVKIFINGVYQFRDTWSITTGVVTPVGGSWPGDGVTVNMEVAIWANSAISVVQAIPIDNSVSFNKLDLSLQATINGGAVVIAADRTALAAIDTTHVTYAYLSEAGREGSWLFVAGDYSTQIAADTLQGVYVKATAIAATAGAWVRQFSGPANIRWFGADPTGVAACGAIITAAAAISKDLLIPAGTFRINANVTYTDLRLKFAKGAQLAPDTAVVVTFAVCYLDAGSYQIFGGAGTIAGDILNAEVPAIWFGVVVGTTSSQSANMNKLIAFLGQSICNQGKFSSGSYRFDTAISALDLPHGIALVGGGTNPVIGPQSTVFDFSNASAGIIGLDIGSSTVQVYGNRIENIRVQRSSNEAKGSGGIGIRIRAISGVTWNDVTVTGFDTNVQMGATATANTVCTAVRLNGCHFLECATRSLYLTGVYEWNAKDSQFGGSYGCDQLAFISVGPNGLESNATHFDNCIFIGPDNSGTQVPYCVLIQNGFWHNFNDCDFERATQAGVGVQLASDANISLITVNMEKCWTDAVPYGVRNLGAGRANIHLRDCRLGATFAGFDYNASSPLSAISRDVVVEGCNISVPTSNNCIKLYYVRGVRISNNQFYSPTGATVATDASTDMIHLSNNHSIGPGGDANGFSIGGTNTQLAGNTKTTS